MEYIFILALCIFGSVVMDTYGALRNQRFYLCSIILFSLWLVSVFRYQMGSDGLAYEYDFYNNAVGFTDLSIEYLVNHRHQPLWLILVSVAKEFNSWLLMQFFVASFVLPTVTVFAYRSSPFPFTVLLFFFISFYHYFSFEILRESIAIALFLIAILILPSSLIGAVLVCGIGLGFHKFAIVPLMIIILSPIFKYYWVCLGGFVAIAITLIINRETIGGLLIIAGVFFNLDFSVYELNVALSPVSLIMYSFFILLPILCSLRLWVSPRRFPINIDGNVSHACLLVTSFCYVLRVTVFPYFERLVNYFWIVSCVILVVMLIRFSRAQHSAIRAGVVGLSVIVMAGFSVGTKLRPSADTGIPGYYLYYPYANVVFPRESPERIRAAEFRFNMDELEL